MFFLYSNIPLVRNDKMLSTSGVAGSRGMEMDETFYISVFQEASPLGACNPNWLQWLQCLHKGPFDRVSYSEKFTLGVVNEYLSPEEYLVNGRQRHLQPHVLQWSKQPWERGKSAQFTEPSIYRNNCIWLGHTLMKPGARPVGTTSGEGTTTPMFKWTLVA